MAIRAFGYVGTTEVIMAEDWNRPSGTVLLLEMSPPGPGYIIDMTGNWTLAPSIEEAKELIKETRKNAILTLWPVHKQMEAISDQLTGDTTKFEQLQKDIENIRKQYPYPTQEENKRPPAKMFHSVTKEPETITPEEVMDNTASDDSAPKKKTTRKKKQQ